MSQITRLSASQAKVTNMLAKSCLFTHPAETEQDCYLCELIFLATQQIDTPLAPVWSTPCPPADIHCMSAQL